MPVRKYSVMRKFAVTTKKTHATYAFIIKTAARVSFNGRTLASQANNVGSIPITRSI
jgi:hypothetical protein